MKNLKKKKTKRSVPIHRKRNGSEFHQVTTVVLLTFNLQEQPYNIYIPGQPSDTAAYNNYQDRPMILHNGHKYGHTKQDADEIEFAEIAAKMATQVTKLINGQMNLTMEKDA